MDRATRSAVACSIPGCDRKVKAQGWCSKHYVAALRHEGNPLAAQPRAAAVLPGAMCSIENCNRTVAAKGWCHRHYCIARRHDGDPLAARHYTEPGEALAYYLAHLDDQTDECMIWPYEQRGGYGMLLMPNPTRKCVVSVLACEHQWGPMPAPGMQAAHGPCHNRLCWNPRHVSWKTPAENNADKYRDGTAQVGERHGCAVLRECDIRPIREAYTNGARVSVLAERYGVDRATIRYVVIRKTWKHVK